MSIPLPFCHSYNIVSSRRKRIKNDESSSSCHDHCRYHVNDLFLTSDERYEIYKIKAAERPHLLYYNEEDEIDNDDGTLSGRTEQKDEAKASTADKVSEEESSSLQVLPLIDGCDLHGWRSDHLVKCSPDVQGVLNIGASSTMFRRESQWVVVGASLKTTGSSSSSSVHDSSKWNKMKRLLSDDNNIRHKPDMIQYNEYKQLVNVADGRTTRKVSKFSLEYERRNVPVIILGATEGWSCMPQYTNSNTSTGGWTFQNLCERYPNVYWRCSDSHGEMISLHTYAKYIMNVEGLMDDSPLTIFDSEFGDDDSPLKELLTEYTVPDCFSQDLFDLACDYEDDDSDDESQNEAEKEEEEEEDSSTTISATSTRSRPPYRWILIGPERSGNGIHIDPLGTNAWVTLLQGHKRWMFFSPSVPLHEIGMNTANDEGTTNTLYQSKLCSSVWFQHYYPKVTSEDWPEKWKPFEILQTPGETVFVPNGYPHVVINLELTVAITHNYACEFSGSNTLHTIWEKVKQQQHSDVDPSSFASRWIKGLQTHRPDLYDILCCGDKETSQCSNESLHTTASSTPIS